MDSLLAMTKIGGGYGRGNVMRTQAVWCRTAVYEIRTEQLAMNLGTFS